MVSGLPSEDTGVVTPITIQRLASEVKTSYTRHRRSLYPEYKCNDSQRWMTVWVRAAQTCVSKKISPGHLVETAFDLVKPYPHPNQLLAAVVLREACAPEYLQQRARLATLRFRCELDEATVAAKSGASAEEIARGAHYQLSPLFRYVFSYLHGRTDLSEEWREPALKQMAVAPREYVHLFPQHALPARPAEEPCPRS